MTTISHKFVEFIPDQLEDGVIYVSIKYCTAIHKCFCGCGNEVVTPLSPAGWELIFNGKSISLYPSIGNWSFDCRSHYWIRNNKVEWARKWSKKEINASRRQDYLEIKKHYGDDVSSNKSKSQHDKVRPKSNFWSQLKKWRY